MNSTDYTEDENIYVSLKLENENILGTIKNINGNEIVFQFTVDSEIQLDFVEHIDVFKRGKIYTKNLPVVIVSFNKFYDKKSFSKMVIGEIKVLYNKPKLYDLLKNDVISR